MIPKRAKGAAAPISGSWSLRSSGFKYQSVILQVKDHKFELAEKIHPQQAVYFLPKALRELPHVHHYDLVISPGNVGKLQSNSGEGSCARQARPLPGGDQVVQCTRSDVSELRAYDGVIRGRINNQNCRSSIDVDLDQNQTEGTTLFERDLSIS